MFSITMLALLLGLPSDAQLSPTTAAEAAPSPAAPSERWAFSIALGRSFYDSQPHDLWPTSDSIWQLSHRETEFRVTHLGTPMVLGAALHKIAYPAIPDSGAIGAGVVLGAHYPLLTWLHAEVDGTLGLQLFTGRKSVDGTGRRVTRSGEVDLYVRLGAGLALRTTSWLDILARLNLHMDPGGEGHFLGAASVGLRCQLP
jgi:hypothetical protein